MLARIFGASAPRVVSRRPRCYVNVQWQDLEMTGRLAAAELRCGGLYPMHSSIGRALVALVVSVFVLAGCGGGGGGRSEGPPAPPPPPPDSTPDAFSFAERTRAVRGAPTASAPMTVSGINVSTAIGVVGGEYSVGGGAYTSGGGTVGNGATVTVRLTASAAPGGTAEAVLTIGGVSATFRATTSDDVTPPTAAIIFPPRVARTGGSTLMVRGTATDASGPLAAVRVNGVLATSTDGFSNWTAVVPLLPGPNTLLVTAEDGFLNVANAAAQVAVQRNARLTTGSFVLDQANGRAFVADGGADAVFEVSLATGIRTRFADTGALSSRKATAPRVIVLDAQRNRLLVLDSYIEAIVAFDLTTRQRTVLSGESTSTGPRFQSANDLALDSARNRVLVTSPAPAAVIAVDLDSGVRTVLSDATNSGPMFAIPSAIAIDFTRGEALVADLQHPYALYAVHLTSGARRVLSSSTVPNAQEAFDTVTTMTIDAVNDRALLPQFFGRVLAVDLASGQRTVMSAGSSGVRLLYEADDIAVDADRALVLDRHQRGFVAADLADGSQTLFSPGNAASGAAGLGAPCGAVLDLPNGRLLVGDEFLRSIVAIDLATSAGSVLSDGTAGTAQFARPRALALDCTANRLFILEHGSPPGFPPAVVSVELANGARALLSGPTQPNADLPLRSPRQLALDAQGMRLLVTERDDRLVKAVRLDNGERSIVSSDAVPNAANPFAEPLGIVVDAANGRALVASSGYGLGSSVLAMSLVTGQRSVVAANTTGQLTGPKLVALDAARNRVLVVDELRDMIFAVDLTSGAIGSLTDTEDPDNPIDTPNALAYDSATQIAYVTEWNFAAVLAVDLVTGRRAYLSH